MRVFHQLVPIEIGPGGAWTAVTATNALQLVAGTFQAFESDGQTTSGAPRREAAR